MTVIDKLNSPIMYLLVGIIIAFVAVVCVIFMVRAYRAGLQMGIDKVKMKRAVSASATFAIVPSVGILVGVIALAGSLGIPLPWLRLSVVGALHYETQVAQVAAEATGVSLSASQMTEQAFVTIAFLMALCICWGMVLSIIFTKRYSKKLMVQNAAAAAPEDGAEQADNLQAMTADTPVTGDVDKKASDSPAADGKKKKKFSIAAFGDVAMTAMFIGLVSAYIGSYIGTVVNGGSWIALAVALVGAAAMAVFIWLKEHLHADWVDNFSIAGSMLIAMASAVLFAALM